MLSDIDVRMEQLGIIPLGPWQRVPPEWLDSAGAPLDERERS